MKVDTGDSLVVKVGTFFNTTFLIYDKKIGFKPYFVLECTCSTDGSVNDICNVETGKCTCNSASITNFDCTACVDNYYGFPACGGSIKFYYFLIQQIHSNDLRMQLWWKWSQWQTLW